MAPARAKKPDGKAEGDLRAPGEMDSLSRTVAEASYDDLYESTKQNFIKRKPDEKFQTALREYANKRQEGGRAKRGQGSRLLVVLNLLGILAIRRIAYQTATREESRVLRLVDLPREEFSRKSRAHDPATLDAIDNFFLWQKEIVTTEKEERFVVYALSAMETSYIGSTKNANQRFRSHLDNIKAGRKIMECYNQLSC